MGTKVPHKQDSPYLVRKGKRQVSQEVYVWHWTAQSDRAKTLDVLRLLARGRAGIPGPLCSVATEANGQRWRVATDSVKTNNLGKMDLRVWNAVLAGKPPPSFTGKPPSKFISTANNRTHGNELMISGSKQSWTLALYRAAVLDSAQWCAKYNRPVSRVVCHSELAYWRKVDVSSIVDMSQVRLDIQHWINTKQLPKVIPFVAASDKPTLRLGNQSHWVNTARRALGMSAKSKPKFGTHLHNRVREFQSKSGLMPDGIIGKDTWRALTSEPAPRVPSTGPFTKAQLEFLDAHYREK